MTHPDVLRVRQQSTWLMVSLAVNVALAIALIVLAKAALPTRVTTVGVTNGGVAIPMVSLDQEYMNDSRVAAFAYECLLAAFSHDFQHYRSTVLRVSECFTSDGNDAYLQAIAPLLEVMKNKRMIMSIAPEPPVVVRKGLARGVYSWEVEAQASLFMNGPTERALPQKYLVQLGLKRVPLTENVRGVALTYINLKPTAG